MSSALISPAELKTLLSRPDVKILDASYNLPPSAEGIAGARNFDIDDIADPVAPYAHTVPTEEIFSAKVRALGISNDDTVIVYDRGGMAMAAARAWWMFRLFGHENVRILNGGLPAWIKAGYETEVKPADIPAPGMYVTKLLPGLLKSVDQVAGNLLRKEYTVLDARDIKRFEAGHIPDSLSVHYAQLLNDGALKSQEELQNIFDRASVDPNDPIICTCGSGVTACVIALALHELGNKKAAVYDGSWTEWGATPILPKIAGAVNA